MVVVVGYLSVYPNTRAKGEKERELTIVFIKRERAFRFYTFAL